MRGASILAVLLVLTPGPAAAAMVVDLYRAVAVVTGTEEPERTRGFRAGLVDVVVKLTGDIRQADNPALAPLLARPHDLVEGFDYVDRMKGIPVHDEQGTRQRPHDLRMRFRPEAVDRWLARLGLSMWSADRPRIAVWLAIRTAARRYVLRARGEQGYGQRAVFVETARRRGIPIVLPPPEAAGIAYDDVASGAIDKLARASSGAEAMLIGTLVLGTTGYWHIRWALHWRDRTRTWGAADVTFDTAIRDGLQRSALVLSGNAKD